MYDINPTIFIGADHRGFESKEIIKVFLNEKGYKVEDKGAFLYDAEDDYPDFALAVAEEVSQNKGSLGIVLCGSSIGVSVAANKVKGIFASQVRTPEEAIEDKKHHDSNILALSADNIDTNVMKDIITVWLATEFEGGRHARRLEKIWAYEMRN